MVKRIGALILCLCMCVTLLLAFPVSAAAGKVIEHVLCSLNYPPVALMELQYVSVTCSGTGYHITDASWYAADGSKVQGTTSCVRAAVILT